MSTQEHPHISSAFIKLLPQLPGVYLMKDTAGEVLYVGKAINLRARVRSYFNGNETRSQIPFLLVQVTQVDTIITQDERQAILLENDLIKKYKPRYNVRLKDDRAHLIVRIDRLQEWPRIELVRRIEDDGAQYIGPFAYGYEIRSLLEIVKRAVPLRTCSDRVLHNRVRPCLEYQIKRCAGPCCLDVDKAQYLDWIEMAVQILKGKNTDVVDALKQSIEKASAELRFEEAAEIRDRLEVLERANSESLTQQFSFQAHDAFGFYRDGSYAVLSVMMVRQGRLFEAKNYSFQDVAAPDEEFFGSLITQYYEGQVTFPEQILIPFMPEDADSRIALLSEKAARQIELHLPQKGAKARLLELANENARENYDALVKRRREKDAALHELFQTLELENMPRIIECVDISHFQGGETVASVVQFKDGKPEKSKYRRFILAGQKKPDDFASMREVLERHFSQCAESGELPDVMVIDGGPGQLSQGLAVRRALGLDAPPLIGLAKARTIGVADYHSADIVTIRRSSERVYREGVELPVVYPQGSKALQLLEQIRNEAHRFAISFHRQRRSQRLFQSRLEDIPGVGRKRRMDLLRAFRSVDAIRAASPEDLRRECGIPKVLAERIIKQLRQEET